MPTGSLCSERNAIGTALATTVGIRREHFKAVAIMSTSKVRQPGYHTADSPRRALSAVRPGHISSPPSSGLFSVSGDSNGSTGMANDSSSPSSSQKRARNHAEDSLDAWRLKRWRSNSMDITETGSDSSGSSRGSGSGSHGDSSFNRSSSSSSSSSRNTSASASGSSGNRIDTSGGPVAVLSSATRVRSGTPYSPSSRRAMMGPRVHVPADLNPIAPCGACSEWLKKIAEVNPDFRVLMFEDTSCAKVFVRSIFGVETA